MRKTKTLVIAAVVAASGLLAAQQPQTTQPQASTPYRSTTDLVSVYVTVTDEAGRLVPGLTQDDFEIRDNGKKQPITLFNNEELPFSLVMMLDCSGSMAENHSLLREGAASFVSRLIPHDRVRIGSFAKDIRIEPATFTGDQDQLQEILKTGLQTTGPSPVWTAVDRSITALLSETGRRVVLIFTDGHDSPGQGQVVWSVKDVAHRAEYDEIMVYAVGFSSEATQFGMSGLPPPFNQPRGGGGGGWGGGWRPPMAMTRKVQPPDPALRSLAENTGGGYFEVDLEHSLAGTFAQIADELHRQYWIGFKPSKLDGKTHEIDVKLKRADLAARARKTYVADRKK